MNKTALKNIIEGILLSSFEPISADKLYKVISKTNQTTKADILDAIEELKEDYSIKEIEIFKGNLENSDISFVTKI